MFPWRKKDNKSQSPELTALLAAEHCDGCKRNCPLSAPKCPRGKRKANAMRSAQRSTRNGGREI